MSCCAQTEVSSTAPPPADNTMIQMTGAATGLLVTRGASATRSRCGAATRRTSGTRRSRRPRRSPAAGVRLRRPRAARRRGRDRRSRSTRRRCGVRRASAEAARRDVDRHRLPPLLHQPGARAAGPRAGPRGVPGRRARLAVARGACPSRPSSSARRRRWSTPTSAPPIARYLGRLEEALRAAGFRGELLIASRTVGSATRLGAEARSRVMGSGPTGGVMGARRVPAAAGVARRGVGRHGRHLLRRVPDPRRDARGQGRLELAAPLLRRPADGRRRRPSAPAAGRSPACESGALQVGPQSAGAEPGPVCYRRGGVEPTVTDANVVPRLPESRSLLRRHDATRRARGRDGRRARARRRAARDCPWSRRRRASCGW